MDTNLAKSHPTVIMRSIVELVLERLADGETVEHILETYPHLTREAISAALAYAVHAFRALPPENELFTEIQLEIARKQGEALIASAGMDLQAKLAAFATDRIDEISQTIGESRQKFLQRIKPQLEDLDNYKAFPEIYVSAQQSIKNEIRTYFESIDELLKGFIEALEVKVANSKAESTSPIGKKHSLP